MFQKLLISLLEDDSTTARKLCIKCKIFYCLWLPKGGIAKLVEIEKVKEKDLKEFIETEVKGKWQNTK